MRGTARSRENRRWQSSARWRGVTCAALGLALSMAASCGDEGAGPEIDDIAPSGAVRGAPIEILGQRFCGDGGDVANDDGSCVTLPDGFVSFGPGEDAIRALDVNGWRHEQISVTVPDTAAPGATVIVVTVDGVPSSAAPFEIQ